jgi:putative lipase involved disintegration of autophagic bodies
MPVGWEPDDDGFRGYVFATEDNSTVVLTIKGTSPPIVGGGPTIEKDKVNDNLLFSCCCARVSRTWTPVCDCYRGGWKCNQECVESALIDESLFYPTGVVRFPPSLRPFVRVWSRFANELSLIQNLFNNITIMYPNANIWVIGHSLGGSLASLLGVTFGAPVVTFEPPGERMAAQRLHLPSPVRPPVSFFLLALTFAASPCSRRRITLRMCGTQQIRSLWGLARARSRPAAWQGMRWRAGATLATS